MFDRLFQLGALLLIPLLVGGGEVMHEGPTSTVQKNATITVAEELGEAGQISKSRMADCSQPVMPEAFKQGPLAFPGQIRSHHSAHFASASSTEAPVRGFRQQWRGGNYLYQLGSLTGKTYGQRSWVESWRGQQVSVGVSSTLTETGNCLRVMVKVDPPGLQVGLEESTQTTAGSYLSGFGDETYEYLTEDYEDEITYEAVEPGEALVTISIYKEGEGKEEEKIAVWTDARGRVGQRGATFGHEHKYDPSIGGSTPQPTIMLQGQESPGQQVTVKTAFEGEAKLDLEAGYRGGLEMVIAQAQGEDGSLTGSPATATVGVRQAGLTDFLDSFMYTEDWEPSNMFPVLIVGSNDYHYYTHYMKTGKPYSVFQAINEVWKRDSARVQATARDSMPHYIALGNMSLEYGGAFHPTGGNGCRQPGQYGHDRGLEFDIAPCYSGGEDGQVLPGTSCGGDQPAITEADLVSAIVGQLGGVITQHGGEGGPMRGYYHVRLPPE